MPHLLTRGNGPKMSGFKSESLSGFNRNLHPRLYPWVGRGGADRFVSHDLDLPDNISLLFLPPYSPELNPIENLFQFIKHNFLNARVYNTYEDIVDACCWAWSRLLDIKGQRQSITTRSWAKAVNV